MTYGRRRWGSPPSRAHPSRGHTQRLATRCPTSRKFHARSTHPKVRRGARDSSRAAANPSLHPSADLLTLPRTRLSNPTPATARIRCTGRGASLRFELQRVVPLHDPRAAAPSLPILCWYTSVASCAAKSPDEDSFKRPRGIESADLRKNTRHPNVGLEAGN